MTDPQACERCAQSPDKPTGVETMRFDYAWKWFNFHADQRTKMFNYMLIGMGIFATALVTAIDKRLELEAAVLSSAAAVVALVFCMIDHRNRQLYLVAMDVLIDAEKRLVFADAADFLDHRNRKQRFGISSRIAWEDKSAAVRQQLASDPLAQEAQGSFADQLRDQFNGILGGQHRYWMPFIALSFVTLFLVAATRAWLIYTKAVPFGWVIAEGVVLMAIGAWALQWGVKVWRLACILFGATVVVVGLLWPPLRQPLTMASDIEVAVGADLNTLLDLRFKQPVDKVRGAELGLLASARLGPFESGGAVVDCSSAAHAQAIAEIRSALDDAQRRQQRVMLLFVGGTDRAPLSPPLRRLYGSDAGLARARITAVERCLWPAGTTATTSDVVRVISAPAYPPMSQPAGSSGRGGAEEDRAVRIVVVGLRPGQ